MSNVLRKTKSGIISAFSQLIIILGLVFSMATFSHAAGGPGENPFTGNSSSGTPTNLSGEIDRVEPAPMGDFPSSKSKTKAKKKFFADPKPKKSVKKVTGWFYACTTIATRDMITAAAKDITEPEKQKKKTAAAPIKVTDNSPASMAASTTEIDMPRSMARTGSPGPADAKPHNKAKSKPASASVTPDVSSKAPAVTPPARETTPPAPVVVKPAPQGTANGKPFIALGDKKFYFRDNPVACIDGKYYVCASDPDFERLFKSMGLTYSWLSYSGKLFVFLPQGSLSWRVGEKTATIGSRQVTVPSTARENFGGSYVPLDSLAMLLDLKATGIQGGIELRPGVQFTAFRATEEKTIDIQLNSASPLKYDVKYQARPPAVRLSIPGAAFNGKVKRFFVEGVEVRINDTVDPETLFVTMEFPQHWKGKIVNTTHKNQLAVRMKPNLVYAWGTTNEALRNIEVTRTAKQVYLEFETTGYVQYYWSYDPEEGVLFVDIPFALPEPGLAFNNVNNGFVKKCTIETLKPDDVPITRLRMELAQGAAFMIGPPQEQKDCTFALLVGPKSLIASPSPRSGGSGIAFAGTGNNLIVIDPGHGGSDPGACNKKLGLKESVIALDISKNMAKILTRMGYRIVLTRYNDSDVTYPGSPDADELMARCDVANKHNAALFVSVHCNASVSNKLRGSSYHWYKAKDREVAHALKDSLGPNIGTIDKGPRKDRFYVLSHTKVPSVLVECAFISNPKDVKILANKKHRVKIARRLARSIDMWLRNKNLARTNKPVGSDE